MIKHIIIADDDSDDVELFQDMANNHCPDLKITIAENGMELLILLQTIPTPDAILLDINMPLKDGHQCLNEIRSNVHFNNIPVIMLSTSNNENEIKSLLSGADYYFVKPVTYDGLKEIVNAVCKGTFAAVAEAMHFKELV